MNQVRGLSCLRCGALYPIKHYAHDCLICRPTVRSNLTVVYDRLRIPREKLPHSAGTGLWRYADFLPLSARDAVSLGEGGTPLRRVDDLGARLGIRDLYMKDESRNPTWSFKDRFASLAISSAKKMGAKVIVTSSSGNAGAATAAYAAKAGIPCVVFTFQATMGPMLAQMLAYGAMVLAVANKADRWHLMEAGIGRYGWFPTSPFSSPAVGSNPLGIEGYKTIAYEIAEAMEWQVPDWCVLPVCYGDALVGIWKGFEDMMAFGWTNRMPRMAAAEIYGSISAALDSGAETPPDMTRTHDTIATSIGATQSTFQALDIIRRSGGTAIRIDDEEMKCWQLDLARHEGVFLEHSSIAPLAAVDRMRRDGLIHADETVVMLATASGLKSTADTKQGCFQPPLVAPNLDDATAALADAYRFNMVADFG